MGGAHGRAHGQHNQKVGSWRECWQARRRPDPGRQCAQAHPATLLPLPLNVACYMLRPGQCRCHATAGPQVPPSLPVRTLFSAAAVASSLLAVGVRLAAVGVSAAPPKPSRDSRRMKM